MRHVGVLDEDDFSSRQRDRLVAVPDPAPDALVLELEVDAAEGYGTGEFFSIPNHGDLPELHVEVLPVTDLLDHDLVRLVVLQLLERVNLVSHVERQLQSENKKFQIIHIYV